jgi:hypothetical protein
VDHAALRFSERRIMGLKIGDCIRELEDARARYGEDAEVVCVEVLPGNKLIMSFIRRPSRVRWPFERPGIVLATPELESYGKHEVKKI